MMKLFLRDHLPLICFTVLQLTAIFLVYWFDGYHHVATALYAMFLGICFLLRIYSIVILPIALFMSGYQTRCSL